MGGVLTSASALDCWEDIPQYEFDASPYRSRVYQGFIKGASRQALIYGPNIKDWPEMSELTDNILLNVTSKIMDPVTTTDELIPSGETSSFRSNPLGLAEFTFRDAIRAMSAVVRRLRRWKNYGSRGRSLSPGSAA
jgi:aconitate hydratase